MSKKKKENGVDDVSTQEDSFLDMGGFEVACPVVPEVKEKNQTTQTIFKVTANITLGEKITLVDSNNVSVPQQARIVDKNYVAFILSPHALSLIHI